VSLVGKARGSAHHAGPEGRGAGVSLMGEARGSAHHSGPEGRDGAREEQEKEIELRQKGADGRIAIDPNPHAWVHMHPRCTHTRGPCPCCPTPTQILRDHGVSVWVRRGGPNFQDGLARMADVGKALGIPMHVYGPDTHITAIVPLALGVTDVPLSLPPPAIAPAAAATAPAATASPPRPPPPPATATLAPGSPRLVVGSEVSAGSAAAASSKQHHHTGGGVAGGDGTQLAAAEDTQIDHVLEVSGAWG
jgi:hypothetical protein